MTIVNDSVKVTPGSGATVATSSPGGYNTTEYQVVIPADATGHMAETKPTYGLYIPNISNTVASMYHWELFNGAASGLTVTVFGIWPRPATDVANGGTVSTRYDFFKTTTLASGGSACTYESASTLSANFWRFDSGDAAMSSQVTCKTVLTSITTSFFMFHNYVVPLQTNAASVLAQGNNLVPSGAYTKKLVLRQGEGIAVRQGTVATVASTGWFLAMTTDP